MSNGGVFTLLTNDGKQDNLLMSSGFLKHKLAAIEELRRNTPNMDPTPTLSDIESTHILFVNANFKPFVAMGFEYYKVTASSGSVTLGSEINFQIPQYGDFFHDMVLYVRLKQPVLTANPGVEDSDKPLMRWCAYPGERIVPKYQFEINGNPLDEYYDDDVNLHREFMTGPHKMLSWERQMGQEEAEEGFFQQPNWSANGYAPADISHRFAAKVHAGDQTPSGQKDLTVSKELMIPLLFWFNTNVRLSIPSVAIPNGQRYVKLTLASGNKLVGLVPRGSGTWDSPNGVLNYDNMLQSIELYVNNIFVNREVHEIFIKRVGFYLIRVHRRHESTVNTDTNEIHMQQIKWPIEYMFVGMRIKEYKSGSSETLIRQHLDKWHTFHQVQDRQRSLQGWNAEKLRLVVAQYATLAAANVNDTITAELGDADDSSLVFSVAGTGYTSAAVAFPGLAEGDLLSVTVAGVSKVLTVLSIAGPLLTFSQNVGAVSDDWGVVDVVRTQAAQGLISFGTQRRPFSAGELVADTKHCVKTLDTISVSAHTTMLYSNLRTSFFNSYIPYKYGGSNINSPRDCGALMITFCLYPGTYQPSGHINISRAREFYFKFTSSVISTTTTGHLIVCASAINFLLITDGSALLRYTT